MLQNVVEFFTQLLCIMEERINFHHLWYCEVMHAWVAMSLIIKKRRTHISHVQCTICVLLYF